MEAEASSAGKKRKHPDNDIITLNVGGSEYTTTVTTLTCRYPESFFATLARYHVEHEQPFRAAMKDNDGRLFLDADGPSFGMLLNFLRSGCMDLQQCQILETLRATADYYNLPEAVRQIDLEISRRDKISYLEEQTRSLRKQLKQLREYVEKIKPGKLVDPKFARMGEKVQSTLVRLSVQQPRCGKIVGIRQDEVWVQWEDRSVSICRLREKTGVGLKYV
ncbi:uncharacterized protein SPPG_06174 [Spizellomyces punctatus DAOM BR117]|uniref:BTB domain-containing protein n=1 Tax=Spizellomyces punctatus (strain DAOM BR117) TaxID=645134 RepID=A0A0L0HCI1_SPIPD|nr:uncharacterized protein SPPG_06174 [Spizellomyces punctatus DAOM BR117]KNC98473.1 hypothetical protein SPPG_06174 [Spizellomyces punctatus DAOM BR117]|eukprot:XP_016606513.1 hypothetical protein SPPG_06174 [Spizellomyces punctatus DAOM BR117]